MKRYIGLYGGEYKIITMSKKSIQKLYIYWKNCVMNIYLGKKVSQQIYILKLQDFFQHIDKYMKILKGIYKNI